MNAIIDNPQYHSCSSSGLCYSLFSMTNRAFETTGIIPVVGGSILRRRIDTVAAPEIFELTQWPCDGFWIDDAFVKFTAPIMLSIMRKNDEFSISYSDLGIEASSQNEESVKAEFEDELRYCYKEYFQCSDNELLHHAKLYKNWFRRNL